MNNPMKINPKNSAAVPLRCADRPALLAPPPRAVPAACFEALRRRGTKRFPVQLTKLISGKVRATDPNTGDWAEGDTAQEALSELRRLQSAKAAA